MKRMFLFLSMPLVILCSFVPSTTTEPPSSMQEVHERFVTHLFSTADTEFAKDKGLKLKLKPYPEEPEADLYVGDYCQVLLGSLYGYFQESIDEKAEGGWYSWYGKTFDANYKRLLGTNLIKKKVALKSGTSFNYFDGVAVEKTFQALYKKPTEKFKGLFTYQRIYDASVKDFAIETADFIAEVMQNKKGFEAVTASYKNKMDSEEFYGPSLPDKTWETIFDKSKLQQDGDYYYYTDKKCGYASDILVTMVRRNVDGSLPTFLKLFKQILQDYDKATFEKYKNKF